MKDICTKIVDGDHNPPKGQTIPTKYIMISSKNINNHSLCSLDEVRYLSAEQFCEADGRTKATPGDIFMTSVASLGRTVIYDGSLNISFQRSVTVISTLVSNRYLQLFIDSPLYQKYIDTNAKGTAQRGFYLNQVEDSWVPIPPYAEQEKIYDSAYPLLNIVDEIEGLGDKLKGDIDKVKGKVLALAISGKLVSQDPSDEPAIELLRRINPDFKPCDNSHYPFEIPTSWVFASGKDIFLPMKSTKPSGDEFSYIDIDSIDNKNNVIHSPKRVKTENAPSRASRFTKKGDVVFSMVRPYLRNIAAVRENGCIASTGFFVCSPNKSIHPDYMFLMMLSSYVIDGLNQFMKGDNSPSINTDNVLSWKYPVPPLNEQNRIVAEVQRLYLCLEQIETHLTK